jgi:hypothetical protein
MKTKRQSYIYVGPSVPQVGLKQNTLYKDENPPEALAKFAQEKPVLRALYVSTKDLAKTQVALAHKGSVEHAAIETLRALAKTIAR